MASLAVPQKKPSVFLAILVKDKEYCLDLYLECIEKLEYPKNKITIYIRANDCKDNSIEKLQQWSKKNKDEYADVIEDYSDVDSGLKKYGEHEWNAHRFSVLARIRQDSIEKCMELCCDYYFVVDVDNFIKPHTLRRLIDDNLPVVGPLLRIPKGHPTPEEAGEAGQGPLYSNYHHPCTPNGYYQNSQAYYEILEQRTKGLICVDVIHTTYLIKKSILPFVSYIDGTKDYEYVIFSRTLRNKEIQQYIDNHEVFGYITFNKNFVEPIRPLVN